MLQRNKVILYLLNFTNLVTIIFICFFKNLVDQKNDNVKFDNVPKTNEEHISVTYGCVRFIYSHQFLSSRLG